MAPRFPRRRSDADEPPEPDDEAEVCLDDDEHAWWAQRDLAATWRPREAPTEAPRPERDVLADHFGADWRSSFGFDAPPASGDTGEAAGAPLFDPDALFRSDEPAEGDVPPEPPDTSDPYATLGIEATASWEEIVAAHRSLARRHHPDRLVGRSAAEVSAGEDRIRAINAAYAELRVRRGR